MSAPAGISQLMGFAGVGTGELFVGLSPCACSAEGCRASCDLDCADMQHRASGRGQALVCGTTPQLIPAALGCGCLKKMGPCLEVSRAVLQVAVRPALKQGLVPEMPRSCNNCI